MRKLRAKVVEATTRPTPPANTRVAGVALALSKAA